MSLLITSPGFPALPAAGPAPGAGAAVAPEGGFARVLGGLLGGAGAESARATEAIQQLAQGQTDNLHGVALAAARADLSLALVLEIRNRLQDAYQEVMRMQI